MPIFFLEKKKIKQHSEKIKENIIKNYIFSSEARIIGQDFKKFLIQ